MNVKQVLVVRKDLNMRKGKIAAQCAHASMKVILDRCSPMAVGNEGSHYLKFFVAAGSPLEHWVKGSFTKVVVSVDSEAELLDVLEKAKAAGLITSLITDAGLTEFHGVPTNTVVAIGPGLSETIDPITGQLKLI
jgi:PTH2 family peptidyl-tRNA hydrolase